MVKNYNYKFEILGFVNDRFNEQKEIDGFPVLGNSENLLMLCEEHNSLFINAITSTKTIRVIERKFENFQDYKNYAATILHPSAFIAYNVEISSGVFVGPQNYIGENTKIGNFVFIHSQSYIARNVKIGNFSYFAPKSYIGAEAKINDQVYVGINAVIKERLTVNKNAIIGMGSIMLDNVEENAIYFGQKAKKRN